MGIQGMKYRNAYHNLLVGQQGHRAVAKGTSKMAKEAEQEMWS